MNFKQWLEAFESDSQRKLFWARCKKGKTKSGKKVSAKKWCRMAREYEEKTAKGVKLPYKKRK